ncbi:type VI secretion system lipoprotein TssJ [uncultured Desulfovibrio sp.]|uniref:type VI secretion system lipoprotein TssJ n=1 Tax=uncultured Desulfovibrio sp. TaxID=167968 RepID=UPI0026139A30|nr:type VI secretion system lipoprotein TssJ [uncultured Desulfovibrio sp.]
MDMPHAGTCRRTRRPAPGRACRPPVCLCLLLLLCLLSLGACGGESPSPQPPAPAPAESPSDVVWGLEPGGLRCRLEASPELNRDNDTALGLTLCLYQLKEYDQFSNKAASAEGLDELLQCRPDAAQAQSARLFQLQPGATRDVVMDRAEHARYLGVVAGYTHLRPDQCAAVLPFPLHTESKGVIFRSPVYSAAPVQVLIRLGESSLSITGAERVR